MTNPSRGELVPGGLAMVIGLKRDTHLNGLLVVTDRPGITGQEIEGFVYKGSGGWLCLHEEFEGGHEYFNPKNLMPINPEPDPLEITQHQKQSA